MSKGSSKPCPACGSTEYFRKSNEICWHCKKLLERAKEIDEELSKISSEQVVVSYGKYAHWNQYIYTHGTGEGRQLQELFFKLVTSLSRPGPDEFGASEFDILGKIEGGERMNAIMPRLAAEAIRDLHKMVRVALSEEYQEGKEDGHNLLMRLATGDLAPNEFLKQEKQK